MKKFSLWSVLTLLLPLLVVSCQSDKKGEEAASHPALYATLYQQKAAEYRALCYQAFNLARLQLDRRLEEAGDTLLAVVVDVDETVLDNSPHTAQGILEDFSYPVKWAEWTGKASAAPVPGALEFLQYADGKGVAVFYITNRREEFRAATRKNLSELGFPLAGDAFLLMRTTTGDKQSRRDEVLKNYRIALLAGDNLGDFSSVFDVNDVAERFRLTDDHKERFGYDFIVLPNALYGKWLEVLQSEEYGLKDRLEGF